jgi:hypothetical protein
LSIGASATLGRASALVLYFDVIIVLILGVPIVAAGAPALGYAVGAGAWLVARLVSKLAERRIAQMTELRHRLGYGVGFSMARVWFLAGAIIAAGVGSAREDGLTAALVICGAFSLYFVRSAVGIMTSRRDGTR